jgi:hypothetical protein
MALRRFSKIRYLPIALNEVLTAVKNAAFETEAVSSSETLRTHISKGWYTPQDHHRLPVSYYTFP